MQQIESAAQHAKAAIIRKNSDRLPYIHDISTSTKSLQKRDSDLRKAVVSKQQIESIKEQSRGLLLVFRD